MRKILISLSLLMGIFCVGSAEASFINFSYDIGIPQEYTLISGEHLNMPGRVINTGSVPVDLTVNWGAIWGIPGKVTDNHWGPTNNDGDFFLQFSDVILQPGENLDFTWFNFSVDGNFSAWEGNEYGGAFGIRLPQGATWKQAGYIDNVVEGVWRAGDRQPEIAWNYANIDHTWVNWPEANVIPEPATMVLFFMGSMGVYFIKKKRS